MENENAGVEDVGGTADEQELKEESGAPQTDQDDTNWQAIAEKERERAENYKLALTQKRQLRKAPPQPEIEDEDDDKPITRKELENLLRTEVVPLVASSKEDNLLLQKVSNPAKRAFVKQLLETRVVRTGTSDSDILDDIDAALAIADSKKKDKTIAELARAAQNKPPLPSAGSSEEKPLEQKPYKLSPEVAQMLEKRAKGLGVDPEKFKADFYKNQGRTKVL